MASLLPESAKIGLSNLQTTIFIQAGIVISFVVLAWLLAYLFDIKSFMVRKLILGVFTISGILIASKVRLLGL